MSAKSKTGSNNRFSMDDIKALNDAMEGKDFSKEATPLPKPWTVGYSDIKGVIKENTWYWVTSPKVSYKISPNDMSEQYRSSELHESAYTQAFPMQFIKMGYEHLPYMKLMYRTLSINKLDPKVIRNLSEYLPLLEKEEVIFIDVISGKVIPRNQAALSSRYFYIKKMEKDLEVAEAKRVLYKAELYSYYPNKKLKTTTTYLYNSEEMVMDKRLITSTKLYEDGEEGAVINSSKPTVIKLNDIPNRNLKILFAENQKLAN